jgi:hypothetical protein
MHRLGLVVGMVATMLTCAFAPGAAAHPGHLHGPGQQPDGRQPGAPDFQRIGDTTYRYRPGIGQYEIKKKGRPPYFAHYDDIAALETAEAGPNTPLPESEYPPHCRTSGHRVVVVHTHRSSEPAADSEMKETLRSIVRRMTSKIYYQSIASGSGQRNVELAVDCNAEGQINVYDVVVSGWEFAQISSAVMEELGEPEGAEAVKYLTFDHKDQGGGVAGLNHDTDKDQGNLNASTSNVAIAYRQVWETHVPMHELFHNFGASQGNAEPPPAFSTNYSHCVDGLDILCYEDGGYWKENKEFIFYSETRCPASEGYDEPWKVPIDCKYDTYFDTVPEEGTWLAENWDSGGAENPFLVVPPKATTLSATQKTGEKTATLFGTVNPEGTDTEYYFEYGPDTEYGSKAPVSGDTASAYSAEPVSVDTKIESLKHGTTYHYRLVATNGVGTAYGKDKSFTTSYTPKVTLGGASTFHVEEETGKATLHGTINPKGYATEYHFEWGDEEEYLGNEFTHVAPAEDVEVGEGEDGVAVEQEIEGLEGGKTVYYYRLVAVNSVGTTAPASSFTSPYWTPAIVAEVTDVESESATLTALIGPEGFETTYHLEWGEDEEYGNSIPIPDANVGNGLAGVEVSHTLEDLDPETYYYYRVVGENTNGQGFSRPGKLRTHSHAGFIAGEYLATAGGSGETAHLESDGLFSYECEPPAFAGEMEGPTAALSAQGFEGQSCGSQGFDMAGCKLFFYPDELSEGESEGAIEVGPPGCGPIVIEYKYLGVGCPIEISPQQIFPVTFRNEGEGSEATVAVEVDDSTSFKYWHGGLCYLFGERELIWEGSWDVSAGPPESEEQVGLQMARISPTPVTEAPTSIAGGESFSATLNGKVLPAVQNGESFHYHFEYGTSKAYGLTTEAVPFEGEEEPQASALVEGLSVGETYHYRLVVTDEGEEIVGRGKDETFSTAVPTLEPTEGFPASFTFFGEEEVTLRYWDASFKIDCKTEGETPALDGGGQFDDAVSGTATLALHNCKESGAKSACTTGESGAGTVKAENVPFRLVYLSDGEPGLVFLPNAESEQFISAKCFYGLIWVLISGDGVLAHITDPALNEPSPTLTVDLNATEVGEGEYAQEYAETKAGTEYGLQMALSGSEPEPTTLEADAVASFEEGEGELIGE